MHKAIKFIFMNQKFENLQFCGLSKTARQYNSLEMQLSRKKTMFLTLKADYIVCNYTKTLISSLNRNGAK